MCHKAYTPKTRAERISDTVEFPPKIFHMLQMSSMDATYHAAQSLIYSLQNTLPASSVLKIGHGHKEALKTLGDLFRKEKTPIVPPRVPVREEGQKELKERNQKGTQMKKTLQSKPTTNAEPLRVPIVEAYLDELQPVNQAKNPICFSIPSEVSIQLLKMKFYQK